MSTRHEVAGAFLVACVGVVLLALRAPFAFRQLWAEDGSVFLKGAMNNGLLMPFTKPDAGYFLFVNRMIGAVTSLVPLRAAPAMTWACVALVVGWCIGTVFYASQHWLVSWPSRSLLALSIVLLPALGGEAIGNAANLQFTLLFSSLVVLIGAPRGRWATASYCALVAVTGLTTPLAVFLVPFVAVRMFRRGRPFVDSVIVSWGAGLTVQLLAIVVVRPDRHRAATISYRTIAAALSKSVLFETFSPIRFSPNLVSVVLVIVLGSLITASAVICWRRKDRLRAVVLVAVPLVGVAVFVFLGRRSGLPPRYDLLTAWCLLWASLVAVESLAHTHPLATSAGRLIGVGRFVLYGIVLIAALRGWQPSPYRSDAPNWHDSLSEARQQCSSGSSGRVNVVIAPLKHGVPHWYVRVSCKKLG